MLLLLLITTTSGVQKLYDSFSEVSCACMCACMLVYKCGWRLSNLKIIKWRVTTLVILNVVGSLFSPRLLLNSSLFLLPPPPLTPPPLHTLLNNLESVQNDVLSFPHQRWLPIFSQPCPKPRLSRWRNHAYQIPNPVAAHICLQLNSFTIVETLFPTTPTSDSTWLSHSVTE